MNAASQSFGHADTHAKIMAEFTLEVVAAASETLIDVDDPERGCVNIRVGFHSGPLVADVVGTRNPKFCILGDTVNTASRMESTSAKNRIQCSEASADLIKEQSQGCIELRSRGMIPIKGKGEMRTYWVMSSAKSNGDSTGEDGVFRV